VCWKSVPSRNKGSSSLPAQTSSHKYVVRGWTGVRFRTRSAGSSSPYGSQLGSPSHPPQTTTPQFVPNARLQTLRAPLQSSPIPSSIALSHCHCHSHTGQFLGKVGIDPALPHATPEVGLCAAALPSSVQCSTGLNGFVDCSFGIPYTSRPNRVACASPTTVFIAIDPVLSCIVSSFQNWSSRANVTWAVSNAQDSAAQPRCLCQAPN